MKRNLRSMKTCSKRSLAWVPVTLWLVVIFLFSAQTGQDSGDTSAGIVRWVIGLLYSGFEEFSPEKQARIMSTFHLVIRKGAHFTEFAVLAALIANALRPVGKKWCLPVILSGLYAVSDELHQAFVPGRACRLLDVGIDTAGAVCGTLLFALGVYWIRKRRNKI